MGRLIAVGDIHGHLAALRGLMKLISPRADDEFVLLGDYIDRGPDSKGVVDELIDLCQFCLTHPLEGNHESMLLASLPATTSKSETRYWCRFGGEETLRSYGATMGQAISDGVLSLIPPEHLRFYGNLLPYYETGDHIFVHANYRPGLDLKDTDRDALHWLGIYNPVPHRSGKRVICGHSRHDAIRDWGFLCCIDTGCGVLKSGRLTALEVNSGEFWQVNQDGDRVDPRVIGQLSSSGHQRSGA